MTTNIVTLGGNPIKVVGNFPQKGQTAPDFSLVANDLTLVVENAGQPDALLRVVRP